MNFELFIFLLQIEPNYDVDVDIILYDDTYYSGEMFEDAVGSGSRLWDKIGDKVIIPFTIPVETSEYDRSQINRAIDEFHQKTCIKYVLVPMSISILNWLKYFKNTCYKPKSDNEYFLDLLHVIRKAIMSELILTIFQTTVGVQWENEEKENRLLGLVTVKSTVKSPRDEFATSLRQSYHSITILIQTYIF